MQQETDRMRVKSGGLASQLQQTAESVVKMKVQLESEIKLRDIKIAEYQDAIKQQNESMVSQQQHSEALTHRLQYEVLKRSNIGIKIDATRSICNTLQQHTTHLSSVMQKCVEEKDLIKKVQIEYLQELETLTEKAKDYQENLLKIAEQRDGLLIIYQKEKSQKEKTMDDFLALTKVHEETVASAEGAIAVKNCENEKLIEQLAEKNLQIQGLEASKAELQEQICQRLEAFTELQHHLADEKEKHAKLIDEKDKVIAQLNNQLQEAKSNANDIVCEITTLKQSFCTLEEIDAGKSAKISELSAELVSLQQKLEIKLNDFSTLMTEKIQLEEKVQLIAALERQIEDLTAKLSGASIEIDELLRKCDLGNSKCEKLEALLLENQTALKEKEEKLHLSSIEAETLEEKNKSMENELQNLAKEIQAGKNEMLRLQEKMKLEVEEKNSLKDSLDILKSSSAAESGEMSAQVAQLSRSLALMKEKIVEKEKIIGNLTAQEGVLNGMLDELKETLENQEKAAKYKIETLQDEIGGKETEIAALKLSQEVLLDGAKNKEDEIESLKGQLQEAQDERETLLVEKKDLEKNLKSALSKNKTAENKFERLESKNRSLEKEKKELEDKIAKAKSEKMKDSEKKDQTISDFEKIIKEKDDQIEELEKLISDAKSGSEEELKAKDAQLVEMESEKTKLEKDYEQMERDKSNLEAKVLKLNAQLAETIKSLNDVGSRFESHKLKLQEKIKESEVQLTRKEVEINKLKSQTSEISQSSALSTYGLKKQNKLKKDTPKLKRLQMPENKSILRDASKPKSSKKNDRIISFSINNEYIPYFEDDDSSSLSSYQKIPPKTPAKTRNELPTISTRKSPLQSWGKGVVSESDDEDNISEDMFADIPRKPKFQINTPLPEMNKTPTKMPATSSLDAPSKAKRSRTSGLHNRGTKPKSMQIN
ncbi:early endosome antigen 1-like isoform X2 [Neocloeon triangulifer]|nr:early endosome antigen 1-like isoform X2 [Neocloeon triangulifer]XP_059471312.1 early endosome antigen 1-like isoform X2 [Neocloeon triangulifer]